MIPLEDLADRIETREDLAAFIEELERNVRDRPDAWENATLDRYLAALASWTEDMDGYFLNRGESVPDAPSWRLVGQMLLAAKVYE